MIYQPRLIYGFQYLWRIILSVTFLVSLVACSDIETEVKEDTSMPEMRLSIDLWPGYYPAVIAYEKGWFKEQGLNLILAIPGNTDKMLAQFTAGSIDAVAVAFGDAVLVTRQKKDVSVILVTDESAGGDAVLATDPDILNDLKGKTIGTNLGGFGELLIRTMLKVHNTPLSDVNLINVDASQVPSMLALGNLDVGHTWNPYVGQAAEVGAQVVFSSKDTPGLIPDTVAISASYGQKNPDAVRIFLDVWFKAQSWWLDNFEEGNQLIAKATSQSVADISLDGIKLLNREQNIASFEDQFSAEGLPNVLKVYNSFYTRSGVLREPAPETILASEFLK